MTNLLCVYLFFLKFVTNQHATLRFFFTAALRSAVPPLTALSHPAMDKYAPASLNPVQKPTTAVIAPRSGPQQAGGGGCCSVSFFLETGSEPLQVVLPTAVALSPPDDRVARRSHRSSYGDCEDALLLSAGRVPRDTGCNPSCCSGCCCG